MYTIIPYPITGLNTACPVFGVGVEVLTEPHHFVSKSACQFTQQANLQHCHAWGGEGIQNLNPKHSP